MGLRATKLMVWLLVLTIVSSGFGAMSAMAAEISSLVLNKNELTLEVGGTASLTATAVYDTGTTENVTVKTDWNSGASDVASVYAGAVTAKKEGKAVITATYLGKTVIVNVTVSKHVRSLIKDKQTIDLRKGNSEQVTLTAYYDDGTTEDVTTKAEWNIDNGQVATVVNGLVTGQSSGTAIVSASYNSQTVSIPVNIEIVKRVDPEKSKLSLLLNDSETIKLFATYPDGSSEDVSDRAEWESDNPDIADVIKGKITGYGPGQATITAAYGTKKTTIKVEVDNAIKLDLGTETVLMKKNGTEQLKLMASYAEGNPEEITDRAEWSSSDDSIVSVVKGKLFANASGEVTVTAKYGEKTASVIVDVDVPRRLEPEKDAVDLQTGGSDTITLWATYADGTREDVTTQAKWSVDNEAIAYVLNGKVTAYKAGEATVTATYGEKSVTIQVSVDIPTIIKPSKKTVSFQTGSYEQITLSAIYSDGKTEDITEKAEWSSSAPAIAEVRKGLISGVGTGAATITAKYGTRSATVQVSVGVLKSLTTKSLTSISMNKGATQKLDLTATYTDGTTKDVLQDATWVSSSEKIATVDEGVITALASGEVSITASFETKSVTFTVKVDMADKLTASPASVSFDLGDIRTITLSATDSDGIAKDVTADAEWTSSNPALVTVDKGALTPVARGKATVTAKYGGKTISISVEIGVISALDVDKRFVSTKSGSTAQLVLTATLADGTKKEVTTSAQWKSSNYKIADVTDGLVTGVSAGNATITASFGGKSLAIPVEIDKLKYLKTDNVILELKAGSTGEVKATATYEDLTEEDVTIPALWTSSNIRVADVKDGIIKATGKGKATVTITYGKKKTTVYVIVS
ncbi:Bacterial Ig-like domain (group 2) [Paenibacillus konkukensis]|uniref:Bacterial Ig-like domain (Group 2) n=1 Tax=Paenibacillus konkukensis TaxID=2020716 RepID=A0ABY4RPT1_9BACL|nr:Ig-like domain-containing protein [Paenibacillus konkukensis]UQZ83980.1 Bacterial Ig-like domain (group 2) [Paenibacillus konkukensis]